jgi:hypothetical protein
MAHHRSRVKALWRGAVWLRRHLAITLIVVVSVLVGVATSLIEVTHGDTLDTIYSGLILIASVAILLSAITAALYAQPAYDDWRAQQKPPSLKIDRFVIIDPSFGELMPVDSDVIEQAQSHGTPHRACDRYQIATGSVILVQVSFENTGRVAADCVFNCFVPVGCNLRPADDPIRSHYRGTTTVSRRIVDDPIQCTYSAAPISVPSRTRITFAAEVSVPRGPCRWRYGWPMQVALTPVRHQEAVAKVSWLVEPLSRDEDSWISSARHRAADAHRHRPILGGAATSTHSVMIDNVREGTP